MDSRDLFRWIVLRVLQCYDGGIDCRCSECPLNGYTEYDGEIVLEDICEMIKEWLRNNEIQ